MSLATNRSIRPSSSRSAATTPSPRPSRSTMPACGRHVDEPAAVVAEDMVRQRGESCGGIAVRCDLAARVQRVAETRVLRRPRRGSGRRRGRGRRRCRGRRRPPRSASRGRRPGRRARSTSSNVPSPRLRYRAYDRQRVTNRSGSAVVVVVADGDAVAVAAQPGGQSRPCRVTSSKRAVAAVAEQPVAASEAGRIGAGNGPPWTSVDVEPAVAVVVEQADAAAHRLGKLTEPATRPLSKTKAEAGSLGVVAEFGRAPEGRAARSGRARRKRRQGPRAGGQAFDRRRAAGSRCGV